MAFGINDTQYIDLPPNVDMAYIEGLRTAAGLEFPRVLSEIDSRLTQFNGGLDPVLAGLIFTTAEAFTEGISPVAFDVQEAGEYTIARPQYVEGQGSMLPLRKWDVGVGWTEDGLQEMSLNRIMAQLDSLLLGLKVRARREIFRRLFSDAEVRIDPRTSAVNPGFAGSGTGLNVFNRPLPSGKTLPGGYTHYFRDTLANIGLVAKTAAARLKLWNPGPFELIGSQAMIDAIVALGVEGGFVRTGSTLVRLGPDQAEALVDPDLYVGVLHENIRVRHAVDDFESNHFAIYKSFGALDPRNPLAWRYDDRAGRGRDAYLRSRNLFPLANAEVIQRFGIGVANRETAALIKIDASGSYSPPTIP